ncbi:hypothetical protein MCUN1_001023 [Malassezia cuniculi]|uniref:Mitochondrial carrier n=1 Tax=Malassezia cuniculi TaxID=948313 RepID=A0AAF0JAD1_9BASI|nr:hypothetical protein MCUN1_001023 [Malassezia cuniculi]
MAAARPTESRSGTTSALSGATAGFVSSIVTCPLDVLKTRLQAHQQVGKNRVFNLIKRIWIEDGIRGFYRGLGPTLIGYLPTWAIYFCLYDMCKDVYRQYLNISGNKEYATHIASAMTAGAASTIATSPLWVIKTRFMLQSGTDESTRYRNTFDACRKIYRTEGMAAFYKGLFPSLLGVTHVVIQFPLYEHFKAIATERRHGEHLSPFDILLCSGGSKMLASMTTYPHEVLRTRLQMHQPSSGERYSNFFQSIMLIARKEGIRGFYKGMGVNLVRTVPNSGLTILTYELCMRYFGPVQ